MVKSIYETFEDAEYKQLRKAKGKKTWHDFIMQLARRES